MPVQTKYLPLVGALALLPVLVYVFVRPHLGAMLAIPSTIIIVLSVMAMLWPERRRRSKVFGPGPQ